MTRRFLHYAALSAAAAVIALMGLTLALKYVLLPQIGEHRARIEAIASAAIGLPVRIGGIEASWHGLNPYLMLSDVQIQPPGEQPPLSLPRVDASVSWTSLAFLEPRLAYLVLDRPELLLRRDAAGVIHVAGIPVNTKEEGSDFPDWLLRQRQILVHGARLVWLDEKLGAPPLELNDLEFALHNRFGRHRFGLTATPSAAFAQAIDIRGDARGETLVRWQEWSGRIYMRLSQTELSAWNQWAPWAQETISGGACCMRFWLGFARGQVNRVVGDARLADVSLKLGDEAWAQAQALGEQEMPVGEDLIPRESRPLVFRALSGRLIWHRQDGGHEIRTENLHFVTAAGHESTAARLRVRVAPGAGGRLGLTLAEAEGLRLEAVTALADVIPLPREIHAQLEALNPRGYVEFAKAEALGGGRYRVAARFQEAGINATAQLPGFSGLSGEIEADAAGGRASLSSRGLHLALPAVLRNPLDFTRMEAALSWRAADDGATRLDIATLRLANADLEGGGEGRVLLRPGQAPEVDIQARLSRGQATAVWKYLPWKVADNTHDWIRQGLVGGVSDDTRLTLRGPLDKFPFDQGGGEFLVQVKMRDGALDYAPGWPGIRGIQGWLTFHGMSMRLSADRARILGAELHQVRAHIPDLHYTWEETLFVDGQASGPTAAFLDFIRQSPVFEHTGRFTERFQAEGDGRLSLSLAMPVRHIQDTTVQGRYRLIDNRVDPGGGLPVLAGASGEIHFTEKAVRGPSLSATLLDQPAQISLASEAEGRLRLDIGGRLAVESLQARLPAALSRQLSGVADYRARLLVQDGKVETRIESDLVGVASRLPPPFDKAAAAAVPLSITRDERSGALALRYGGVLAGRLALAGDGRVERAGFRLGGGEAELPASGIVLRGGLPSVDLDAWRRLGAGGTDEAAPLPLQEISVAFGELRIAGHRLHDTHLQARPLQEGWELRLNGREVRGDVVYVPARGPAAARLTGRFRKLDLPQAGAQAGRDEALSGEPRTLLDIQADSFAYGGRELGALTLRLTPQAGQWRLDELTLANPDGRLELKGDLAAGPDRPSSLSLRLKAGNLGRLLERAGYPATMRRGELEAAGQLGWTGGVGEFAIAELGGDLSLQARNGQFTRIEPGVGKLLGVLSLQALPRRIALDFRDVFSEGFAFDEIAGQVHLEKGTAYVQGLKMTGPAARVVMGGKVDLARETQQLRLTIQPRLEESLALGAALVGGPIAGVGALVAGKLLKDPLGQASSFEYQVTGSWTEPVVTKLTRTPAPSTEANP